MTHKAIYLLLFILASCSAGKKDQSGSSTSMEVDIAQVQLTDLDDQPIDLAQYRGKAVFINFWATWCKPCIQEMPTIASAQTYLDNEKVIFLLASNENVEEIETFIKRQTYSFHFVRLVNMEALRIQALPTTFIFNAAGKLKFSEVGYRKWNEPDNLALITKIINDHEK